MLTDTDKYLLESVQKGNYHAYELLFRSYYSILHKYAYSFVRSMATAEDLVSDLFIKIWEQPLILNANISLKGYLFRSVHNSCLNYLSRIQRNFQELDPNTVDKLNTLALLASSDDSRELFMVELEDKIEQAISQLPEECGKIFKMSRQENLSHREIAQKLNISENTVNIQIYIALSKIREILKEYL